MLKTTIPFVDIRGKTLMDLARSFPDKACSLMKASTETFGAASRLASFALLPFSDKRSHAWLSRNQNPFLYEIETFADIIDRPGVYSFNLSYEWACTTGAYRSGEDISLLRVLDWPFPALGKHVMVVLQSGKAGDFYNVTWPGVSGMFTGMAPGRFSAAINLAPMRKHGKGLIGDWLVNRKLASSENGLPPAHLLRQVFEQAKSYEDAKKMLVETRLAVPAIFVLAGTRLGEGCVIERLENTAEVTEMGARQQLPAANHFTSSLTMVGQGWRPREADSEGRYKQASTILGHDMDADHFEWLRGPIISQLTRLCVVANAATNRLVVQGFEGVSPATDLYVLPKDLYAAKEAV